MLYVDSWWPLLLCINRGKKLLSLVGCFLVTQYVDALASATIRAAGFVECCWALLLLGEACLSVRAVNAMGGWGMLELPGKGSDYQLPC